MSGQGILITTSGVVSMIDLPVQDDDQAIYLVLTGAVGGFIEVLRMGGELLMVINEEGKMLDLPHNPIATELCYSLLAQDGRTLYAGDRIVGNVVLIATNEESGRSRGLTEDEIKRITDTGVKLAKKE